MLEMRKMKDSGIEWIGEIPEGWEVIPAKFLFKNSDMRRIANDNSASFPKKIIQN